MTVDTLAANSRVVKAPEKQGAVAWPLPVEMKLDRLLRRAEEAGERTSREEVVAALIAEYDGDEDDIASMLKRYRRITVRELLAVPDSKDVIDMEQYRKPGPRSRDRHEISHENDA